ncbi:acyl-CoA synthetase (AMP-forming)/AMP-acid ligase II [Edaphobacter aggregans]|uniref:Acyl-CoA synthetase (AMP-forming)/AMP-acid ligase II n=1 Tax=Edaphobacter aggregans TaxID=570835 RepID=A0A3R9QF61_9BACT|nr:class I adenylate-forming enzyme family protein [Edaphobacter aggregans]RSL15187.1 acyl-CoA synthetase (AMP-forming)/AMP-acid ligase II [Edaphobacter aggregans]
MAAVPGNNFSGRLVNRLGEHSCLIDAKTGKTTLPSDLRRAIISFGASLLSTGLKPSDRILIGCTLSPSSSIAYLGAMYAGLVPVPLEEAVLVASITSLLNGTGARAVWTERSFPVDGIEPRVLVFHGLTAEKKADELAPAPCEKNDVAVLFATSGSTGTPRFVMVSHGNLVANTEAIIRSQSLSNDERAMLILPLSYCFGASILHTHLYQGGGVVFDRRFMFPDKVLHAIDKYACTTFAGVPTVFNILLRRSNIRSIAMPTLRRFLQAGGSLAPQRITEMRAAVPRPEFYVMYGQTEATARISCLEPERLDEKLGSAGRPLDNLAVRIVDEDGKDLPAGEVGEIVVKGPSITLGYLNEPEESRRVFDDGWLRTGDLAHLDAEGYIWIDGRMGSFLKMRGVRVSFEEVEAKVAAVPGVYECAAAAVPHPEVGEALALYIVPDKGAEDIIDRVRRSVSSNWTCESIQIVSEIPKTARGKVSRASLRSMVVGTHG